MLKALEFIGFLSVVSEARTLSDTKIRAPCRTNRRMLVLYGYRKRELKPSCVTLVEDGIEIVTESNELAESAPKRVVSSFQGRAVGVAGRRLRELCLRPLYSSNGNI